MASCLPAPPPIRGYTSDRATAATNPGSSYPSRPCRVPAPPALAPQPPLRLRPVAPPRSTPWTGSASSRSRRSRLRPPRNLALPPTAMGERSRIAVQRRPAESDRGLLASLSSRPTRSPLQGGRVASRTAWELVRIVMVRGGPPPVRDPQSQRCRPKAGPSKPNQNGNRWPNSSRGGGGHLPITSGRRDRNAQAHARQPLGLAADELFKGVGRGYAGAEPRPPQRVLRQNHGLPGKARRLRYGFAAEVQQVAA